jgi:transposase-like protein
MVDTQLRGSHQPGRSLRVSKRRTYPPEFKVEAVRLVTAQGYAGGARRGPRGLFHTRRRQASLAYVSPAAYEQTE